MILYILVQISSDAKDLLGLQQANDGEDQEHRGEDASLSTGDDMESLLSPSVAR